MIVLIGAVIAAIFASIGLLNLETVKFDDPTSCSLIGLFALSISVVINHFNN